MLSSLPSGFFFPVIAIVGPTAAGKTEVAIEIAEWLHAVIISADSRQFYQFMNIGTAKPTSTELGRIPHYFIDFLHPNTEYSAGEFSRQARSMIHEFRKQNKNIIVAGGSGMYISALFDGFFPTSIKNAEIKKNLKQRVLLEGSGKLYDELQQRDPQRASELHPNDAHRIVRALEVYYASGQRFSEVRQQPRQPANFPFIQFGLQWPREILYRRIDARVDKMLSAELEREVRSLLAHGVHPQANAMQSVGYREMLQYLRGELQVDELAEKIKQHTRNFAKRQMTWFRKDPRIHWINMDPGKEPGWAAKQIAVILEEIFEQEG